MAASRSSLWKEVRTEGVHRSPVESLCRVPRWVPPLKKEVRRLLDPRRHRSGRLPNAAFSGPARFAGVGRSRASSIDAIMSSRRTDGIWDSSNALTIGGSRSPLFRRGDVARRKGMAFVRGPLNPSPLRARLLVEGFDYPPTWMMAYNRRTTRMVESCGFAKEKDLFAS